MVNCQSNKTDIPEKKHHTCTCTGVRFVQLFFLKKNKKTKPVIGKHTQSPSHSNQNYHQIQQLLTDFYLIIIYYLSFLILNYFDTIDIRTPHINFLFSTHSSQILNFIQLEHVQFATNMKTNQKIFRKSQFSSGLSEFRAGVANPKDLTHFGSL